MRITMIKPIRPVGAAKIDMALKDAKVLGDICDRLSRRVDAFEESAKPLAERARR
jgi:hypothetical protein